MAADLGEHRHPEDRAHPDEWGPVWTDPGPTPPPDDDVDEEPP